MTRAVAEVSPQGGFSTRAVLWMVAVGVLALVAFLVLSAYAPELRRGQPGEHALSRSAVGYAGAVRLMRALDVPVIVGREDRPYEPGVLVLTPGPEAGKALAQVRPGPVLVVLPKWRSVPRPRSRGWVDKLGTEAAGSVASLTASLQEGGGDATITRRTGRGAPVLTAPAESRVVMDIIGEGGPDRPIRGDPDELGRDWRLFAAGSVFRPGPIEGLKTLAGPAWLPVLTEERGGMVVAKHRSRNLYVLSDPDLINTHGLADLRTARFAAHLLEGLRGPQGLVVFDVTLHGIGGERGLLRLALEPPFLGATLCLLAAAVLAGFHAAARFGPPRRAQRAFARGKASLAENTAGLIRLARREHRMGAGYAALVRADAARAVGAPMDLGPEQLDAFLDRLSRTRGTRTTYEALAAKAGRALDRNDLLQVARELHLWKLEVTSGRQ